MAGITVRPIEGLTEKLSESSETLKPMPVTGRGIDTNKRALDVVPMGYFHIVEGTPDYVITAGTTTGFTLAAHGAKVGDLIRLVTTANNVGVYEAYVKEVTDANNVVLVGELAATLANGDTIQILRGVSPRLDASGATLAVISPAPVNFLLDGVITDVVEDTVTPANNTPLPVKLTGITGDINITAGDLNVQTSHTGGSYDSVRIGDGTTLLGITVSNEAKVNDSSANTTLTTISGKLPATLGQKAMTASMAVVIASDQSTLPVSAASLPLPSGASTSALQTTGNTTLSSLLTELQLKADLSETQPVSVASLPLPSGAATSANQTTANSSLSTIATNTGNTNTSVTTTNTNLGAIADAAASSDTGSFSVIAFLKRAMQNWTTLFARVPVVGQAAMAASMPVTIASNQTVLSVQEKMGNGTPAGNSVTVNNTVGTLTVVAGTPYQLWLQADITNTDTIRVSVTGITPSATSGWQLLPGASIGPMNVAIDIKHIAEVTSGQKLNYIWTTRS